MADTLPAPRRRQAINGDPIDTAETLPPGLSLLFRAGHRPAAGDVARLVSGQNAGGDSAYAFAISHRPAADEGWLELLAGGLTFDLTGLSPAPGAAVPSAAHRFGFDEGFALGGGEAITLMPGDHLRGGENLLPVVRAMLGIAAALSALPGSGAVAWHPSRSVIAPGFFASSVAGWLGGGSFPVLGLTALVRDTDGGLSSEGLAYFTGQELRIETLLGETPAQTGKLAIRLIHSLVECEPILSPVELIGPGGEKLRAEPSGDGRVLRIWRNV